MVQTLHRFPLSEKAFYLEEFRGKSLLFALSAKELSQIKEVEEVFAELLHHGTRILLLAEAYGTEREISEARFLQRCLLGLESASLPDPVFFPSSPEGLDQGLLWQVWRTFRFYPFCLGLIRAPLAVPLVTWAQILALRLRVYKLILIDAQGALVTARGEKFSFMNGAVLEEVLRQGEAEWNGLGRHRALLEAVRAALVGGVASVSLCPLSGLAQELFTYEGCGTLFTLPITARLSGWV